MGIHTLPPLPYAYDALEPYIDARTMEIHHTKHHQTYVDKLNAALDQLSDNDLKNMQVDDLMRNFGKVPEDNRTPIRNHGGGHANHSLWWAPCAPTEAVSPGAPSARRLRVPLAPSRSSRASSTPSP